MGKKGKGKQYKRPKNPAGNPTGNPAPARQPKLQESALFKQIKIAIMKGESQNALRWLQAAKDNQKLAEILDFQNTQGLTLLMLACTPRKEIGREITSASGASTALPLYPVIDFLITHKANPWLRSNTTRQDGKGETAANCFMGPTYVFDPGHRDLYKLHDDTQKKLQQHMISEAQTHLPEALAIISHGEACLAKFDDDGNETITSEGSIFRNESMADLRAKLNKLPENIKFYDLALESRKLYQTYIGDEEPSLAPCCDNFYAMLDRLRTVFPEVAVTWLSIVPMDSQKGASEKDNVIIALKIILKFTEKNLSLQGQVEGWLKAHKQAHVSSPEQCLTISDVNIAAFNDKAKAEFIELLEDEKQAMADMEALRKGRPADLFSEPKPKHKDSAAGAAGDPPSPGSSS